VELIIRSEAVKVKFREIKVPDGKAGVLWLALANGHNANILLRRVIHSREVQQQRDIL